MPCLTSSFYAGGAKLRPSQVSVPTPDGPVRPRSVRELHTLCAKHNTASLLVHTAHGDLAVPFDASTSKGRHGRASFNTNSALAQLTTLNPGIAPSSVRQRYVSAILDAQPSNMRDWPQNAYSRKLLTAARTTMDNERDMFGYDALGFDESGHTRRGFDQRGIHKDTSTRFDATGFDVHHRSATGLERPRTWWDEMLDVDPQRASYNAASKRQDYDLALHITEAVLSAALLPTSQLTLAERGELLTQLGDAVAEVACASVTSELANIAPQLLQARPDESVQDHALRLRRLWDPEQFDLDSGLVKAALTRRLAGRFRVAFLPEATISDAELDELTETAITIACEHYLRQSRRQTHPSVQAAA